ncbi:MAG TPA: DUF4232 domain-containing protein [Streptosporangiaceae bacterium]|nr:DUF4232 domain-containing protein [Streptosporangiaceae bacterium]
MSSLAAPARRALVVSFLGSLTVFAAACSSSGSGTASPTKTVIVTTTPTTPSSSPASAATNPAASTPAAPAGPAECTSPALHLAIGGGQGAAGTVYTSIDFTNVSGSACILQGYPGVSLVSAGSDAGSQIGADAKRNAVTVSRPITLAPGQTAHAVLGVANAYNFPASSCHPVAAHWLKVFPPDQTIALYTAFGVETCASTARPTMTITAVSTGKA